MSETVEPRISRGLRDLLPDQMLARQWMIDTIRGVYELYGFVPIGTPAIEYLDVLPARAGARPSSRSSPSRIRRKRSSACASTSPCRSRG